MLGAGMERLNAEFFDDPQVASLMRSLYQRGPGDATYQRLIARIDIADVSSSFAMECIKSTTALPLEYI